MVIIVFTAATVAPKPNLGTMATLSLASRLYSSAYILSLSPSSKSHSPKPIVSSSSSSSSSSSLLCSTFQNKTRPISSISTFALVDEQEPFAGFMSSAAADPIEDDNSLDDGSVLNNNNNLVKPCELDVCNLPRSYGTTDLQDLFKPYGTVHSVEVSRNAQTGISRGCGTVTMSSIDEARAAIAALDGSEVGGREMRVKFSVDMNLDVGRKVLKPSKTKPQKNLIYETPYRIYVGNLSWRVKPEDLRSHFSKFGTVSSAKVLFDRKDGKNRVYGFLSFPSPVESKAAVSLSGTVEYMFAIVLFFY
jgi:RNA recognition motif-containing protein